MNNDGIMPHQEIYGQVATAVLQNLKEICVTWLNKQFHADPQYLC